MASTQTYEDFKPLVEEKDSPDALLLLVHIPGFTKEQIGASFEADTRKIRVFGEKPLPNNKWKLFTEERVIPETCDFDKLKGKFDGTIVTITMPKKPISSVTLEEPKPAQEATKQVTPPTSASGVESEGSTKEGEKGVSQEQPKSEIKSQRESEKKKDETPIPPEATRESQMPQKDKEQLPQKSIKEEERHGDEMETKDASTPGKPKGEPRTAQKDLEGTPQKGKLDDEKHEENKRAERERIQEDNSKTSEAGKATQKVQTLAGEARKGKEIASFKAPEKMQKETDAKTGKVNQRNHGTKENESLIGKGIRDIANSASQAATRLTDKFREEDKQKLLYAGAAILVVAVGIYASFKLRSQARQ